MFRVRIHLLAACVCYIALLHVAYVFATAPYFGYYGMYYSPFSAEIVAWSYLVALMPAAWLPLGWKRPSFLIYYLLYACVIVPACIVPAYTGTLRTSELLKLQSTLLVCFALLGLAYVVPLGNLPRVRVSPGWFFVGIALFSAASYFTMMHYVGFSLRFPNPMDVYDVRNDFKALRANIDSTWLSYCQDWQALVLNPFLVVYGLLSRKYHVAIVGVIANIAIYSLGGLKQVLFVSVMVLGLYLIRNYKHLGITFLWSFNAFVAFCLATDWLIIRGPTGLTSLFTRRIVFMPGQLTGMYFDFFSHNPLAFLGNSILKGLLSYPYSRPIPEVIGSAYFGSDAMNANANIWADGFANFGYLGMIGVTTLLGTVLWLIDSIAARRDKALVLMMLGLPGFIFANSAFVPSMANHGIVFMLALIYFLPMEWDQLSPAKSAEQLQRRGVAPERYEAAPSFNRTRSVNTGFLHRVDSRVRSSSSPR